MSPDRVSREGAITPASIAAVRAGCEAVNHRCGYPVCTCTTIPAIAKAVVAHVVAEVVADRMREVGR